MTNKDKQLIKDIAVICGIELIDTGHSLIKVRYDVLPISVNHPSELNGVAQTMYNAMNVFNPLDDTIEAKAFCWDLVITKEFELFRAGYEWHCAFNDALPSIVDESPQRAVLLAVIEWNKDKL